MKFMIVFIFIPLVSSEIHKFITTYTGTNHQTFSETPEFVAVTSLDGHQMDYYDSNTMKLIPKQPWMEEFVYKDTWKEDSKIRKHVQQIYKNNIPVLMERFGHSHGVHTYQRMYGCDYDDETGDSHGFDEYGYDGEDFITLDLKQLRYITPVAQGLPTAQKWSDNTAQLSFLNQYYKHECTEWLKKFLASWKEDLERRGTLFRNSLCSTPEVYLLQKYPYSPVPCLATGFYPSEVSITWVKNGQEDHEDVDLGELLPNEDGTFQKTSTLHVTPDDGRKQNQYACVVEHQGNTFRKTNDQINRHTKTYMYFCV